MERLARSVRCVFTMTGDEKAVVFISFGATVLPKGVFPVVLIETSAVS